MAGVRDQLTSAAEAYFDALRQVRASGGATGELSTYPALSNLLNAVGGVLRPKVFCVVELAQQGAGHPDFGLYAAGQVQRGQPREGQMPECGVVEVKPASDDAWLTADSTQVSHYWDKYRLVLVTNTRDFVLVGEDAAGRPAKLETFRLAESAEEFARLLQTPRAAANKLGAALGEYLSRAMSHRASFVEPKDLAWLLASYARDGLARVEAAGGAPSLGAVRTALEEALGVRFEEEKGAAFFRSTLVQTLFYGVFSAWVLWARQTPPPAGAFNWHEAVWHLRVPVLQALFLQVSSPSQLQPLGLVEVLDWTSAALDRVDRPAFFAKFNEGEAVPYFYEPFLEAFDPDLRKQLGVWYTPPEVVRYMVARVDRALKDDLGIADGLASENVYVLDPCCGTGAFLAETLRRIAANLEGHGFGALVGAQVKKAAMERVFGFEIMPAPFVVSHLQVGLTMQALDAPLAEDGTERADVFLTNALTGWEPTEQKPLPFPELEEERDRADEVKQEKPVLVVLGNPPYNGYAGMAVDEERELSTAYRSTKHVRRPEGQGLNDLYVRFFRMAVDEERELSTAYRSTKHVRRPEGQGLNDLYVRFFRMAVDEERELSTAYRSTKHVRRPEGQGLNDLYVRFFRMAERRMAEKTGRGVVCLISNYSWLDGLSFTGMRERYLEAFDAIRVDHLNGDKYATGKTTPDGAPDPSIFSTPDDPVGIQVGTAIATLVRKADHAPTQTVGFRNLWGQAKHEELTATAEAAPDALYDAIEPDLELGLPFKPMTVGDGWSDWPTLPELFPVSFPGVKTSRDSFLVDVDSNRLKARVADYFNPGLDHDEIERRHPIVMNEPARHVRAALLARGGPVESGFVRYAYRPLDDRWLYWEADSGLLDRPRPEYKPHVFEGNKWLSAVPRLRRDATEPQTKVTSHIASLHLNEWGASMFPAWLRDDGLNLGGHDGRRPNLSDAAQGYLDKLGLSVEDLFHHVLAVLHDPAYREANAGALRMGWPRIPLPGWPDGDAAGAGDALAASAARGRELAALLDSDTPVRGVTDAPLRPEIAAIAVPSTVDGGNMAGDGACAPRRRRDREGVPARRPCRVEARSHGAMGRRSRMRRPVLGRFWKRCSRYAFFLYGYPTSPRPSSILAFLSNASSNRFMD